MTDSPGRSPARHLVDEAEPAAVAADARVVAETARSSEMPCHSPGRGVDDEVERVAVAQHAQPERAVGGGVLHVEHVQGRHVVQLDDAVAGAQPCAGGRVSRVGDQHAAAA